jgi:hypothetical protein
VNGFAIVLLCVSVAAMLTLPRRWAGLPLLAGACYVTYGQGIEIGPFSFFFLRLLILAGVARVIVRGERLNGGLNGLDWLMIAWGGVMLLCCLARADPSAILVTRLGRLWDCAGIYFLFRIFVRSLEDVVSLCRITAIVLVPVALEMLFERATGHNLFSIFGGVSEISVVREGRIRAQGPFAHPILAGTVGAVCLPLMAGLWRQDRLLAGIGIAATLSIVWASGSSGPIMSAFAGGLGLFLWKNRAYMRAIRWLAFLGYIALDLAMQAPAYYLMGRIDLAGGSAGYHRAALIESAIRHLDEWWFAGTEYTRHWMATGVTWNPNHTDITNHYLAMGVAGGLSLMLLFIVGLVLAFSYVGKILRALPDLDPSWQFLVWALGASLFANAATCISVSYFDQSFLFLYLVLGAIGSVRAWSLIETIQEPEEAESSLHRPDVAWGGSEATNGAEGLATAPGLYKA